MNSFDLVDAQYDFLQKSIEGPSRLTFELSHSALHYAQFVQNEISTAAKENLMLDFARKLKELSHGSSTWNDYLCLCLLRDFVELEQRIDGSTPLQKLASRRQLIVAEGADSGSYSGIDSGTSSDDEKMDVEIQQSRNDLDDSDDIDGSDDLSESGEYDECDDSDESDMSDDSDESDMSEESDMSDVSDDSDDCDECDE
ncbi:unnamed protein product [Caenorhabditis bovis]|uniref:Uncharacterized protein n=1 Tax=Caenorhabditis bovis TaxID=2654633 RepID=A0A8S1EPI8_9PELO|nr:unnamed protein product [Caenorhabditis bovis]